MSRLPALGQGYPHPGGGDGLGTRVSHHAEQQQLAGGADLDVGAHLGADAAVVAGGPATVLDVDRVRVEGVLPVLPEPVLVEPGVEVVPGEHLAVGALAGGEPREVDPGALEGTLRRRDPPVVGEVLAPAVEPTTVTPHLLDDATDPTVPAGE